MGERRYLPGFFFRKPLVPKKSGLFSGGMTQEMLPLKMHLEKSPVYTSTLEVLPSGRITHMLPPLLPQLPHTLVSSIDFKKFFMFLKIPFVANVN